MNVVVVAQCFPIFFWLAPPFLTNKFLSPPTQGRIKGGATGAIAPGPPLKGGPP